MSNNIDSSDYIDDHALCMNGEITVLKKPEDGVDECHYLWPTPVVMAKPFDKQFIDKLREDVQYLLKDGEPGRFNKTDLWSLPDLPDTMIAVKEKKLELMEKYYRPLAEMPLPKFSASKGYFRYNFEGGIYRITPHKHGNTLGVGMIYITVPEDNPGNLVMIDPRGGVNWTNQFTAFKKVRVEEGLMMIHPGYLVHFVEPSDPERGMKYGNRLAIISNLHRTHDDFVKVLGEHEEYIGRTASGDREA
jgi:hypothetical protein